MKLAKADLVLKDTNLLGAYDSFADLEAACEVFCEEVNTRVHRVTRRTPVEMLVEEQARLHPIPEHPRTVAFGVTRIVPASMPMVASESGQYSVPHTLVSETVWVLYLLSTVSMAGSLSVEEILAARDYALAATAEPLFGSWGVGLTRLHDMLHDMEQAPGLPSRVHHQSLVVPAGLAVVVAAFLDLSQIASMGAILYLAMDIAIPWGVIRHLRSDIEANLVVPAVAIALDVIVLAAFVAVMARGDILTLAVAFGVAALIALSRVIVARRDNDATQDALPGTERSCRVGSSAQAVRTYCSAR